MSHFASFSDIGCNPCPVVPRGVFNARISDQLSTTVYDTSLLEGEPSSEYNERVDAVRSFRKVSQSAVDGFPFDPIELFSGDEDPLFDIAHSACIATSFYNMFAREPAQKIQKDFLSSLASLKILFDERVSALSSGIDKASLYEEVKSMGARLDALRRSFPPGLSKKEVFESQDDQDEFTVDRLQELKTMFTTVHFPALKLQL